MDSEQRPLAGAGGLAARAGFLAQIGDLPARMRQRVTLATVGVGLVEAGIATARLLATAPAQRCAAGWYRWRLPWTAAGLPLDARSSRGGSGYCRRSFPASTHFFPPSSRPRQDPPLPWRAPCARPRAYPPPMWRVRSASPPRQRRRPQPPSYPAAPWRTWKPSPWPAPLHGQAALCRDPGHRQPRRPRGHREWERHAKAAAQSACQGVLAALKEIFTTEDTEDTEAG
jgi:hypothetical protein